MPDGPRYDDDFYAWTQYQAAVLRSLPTSDSRFDREHLAEEIEDLGKSELHLVESQITRILEHLLKLAHSPVEQPRYGWMGSIIDARRILSRRMTPSLRRIVEAEAEFASLYQDARDAAENAFHQYGEHRAAAALPANCPYSLDQVLLRNWYPDPPTMIQHGSG